jgi:hypothetical protein
MIIANPSDPVAAHRVQNGRHEKPAASREQNRVEHRPSPSVGGLSGRAPTAATKPKPARRHRCRDAQKSQADAGASRVAAKIGQKK